MPTLAETEQFADPSGTDLLCPYVDTASCKKNGVAMNATLDREFTVQTAGNQLDQAEVPSYALR